MSDMDKLLSRLDSIDGKLNDYEKSSKAQVQAAVDGVENLKAELNAVRQQNQSIVETARRMEQLGDMKRDAFGVSRAEYRSFGEAVKAASEGTDADGGYGVADQYITAVKAAQNSYGVVRQLCDIMPMASDVMKVPTEAYDETSGNVPEPAAVSENAQISESSVAKFGQVTLTARKVATLSLISSELIQDAFLDYVGGYLAPRLGRRFARKEDDIVLKTGNGTEYGLLSTSNTYVLNLNMGAGDTGFFSMEFSDLNDMQDEVVTDALMGGRYIMNRSIVTIVRNMKGDDGHPIWTPAAAGEPATIAGYPYTKAEICPAKANTAASTPFVLFGDLNMACIVGERMQRQMAISEHFKFDYDQIAVRMTERFAFNMDANIGRAMVRLVTAAV